MTVRQTGCCSAIYTVRRWILTEYIKGGEEGATDLEVDFLYALSHTTPFSVVQQKAKCVLERLAARGVKPVTRAVLDLEPDHFYAAYTTGPNHPWRQDVTVGGAPAA